MKRERRPGRRLANAQSDRQDFLPLLVRLQDEPIADNVCIPLTGCRSFSEPGASGIC